METPLTPLEFARRSRKLYGDREGVVDGDLRLTYEQFFDRCDRWSAALQGMGVRKGDRVAYIAPNVHEQLESFYAVPQIGAVLVPINYRLTAEDFVYITSHSGAKVLCVYPDYLDAIDGVRDQLGGVEHFVALGSAGGRKGWTEYEAAVASADGQIRGGIAVTLQPKLADGLPGVRRWFERYPYSCLEQQTSRALGLDDLTQWQTVIARMPSYLDRDGLANYFPPTDDSRPYGSPALSAYLLAVSDEASKADPRFALPDDLRDKLAAALTNFVEGKIERKFWSPRQDLDFVKLSAIEALSRYGLAAPRMLGSITIAPNQWPTSALLDYYAILSRVDGIPQRDDQRAQVEQILRARLTYSGTRLTFSTAADDDLYWLMTGPESNAARTALLFADNPTWKEEMPRLVGGLLALQTNGAWQTTTSNLWGKLAVQRFSRVFESTPVTGQTRIALGTTEKAVAWNAPVSPANPRSVTLPWGTGSLNLTQEGSGKPWATIESLAAVALKAPFAAGYRITKTVTPIDPAVKGTFSRGDIVRVHLDIDAQSDMTWVVVNDPVPPNALGQRILADNGSRYFDQRHQHVEGAPAELDRPAVGDQIAAARQ